MRPKVEVQIVNLPLLWNLETKHFPILWFLVFPAHTPSCIPQHKWPQRDACKKMYFQLNSESDAKLPDRFS